MQDLLRFFDGLGLPIRLALATLPTGLPWLAQYLAGWQFSCFFNDAWYCIYYFHPPFMDVLFALLVLLPFMATARWWPGRVAALMILSIIVHFAAVMLVEETQGSISLAAVDSDFLSVYPIAVGASLVTAAATALLAGRSIRVGLWPMAVLAGIFAGGRFILSDFVENPEWHMAVLVYELEQTWLIWHLGLCVTLYFGTARSTPEAA
jgi:hypothetical protein